MYYTANRETGSKIEPVNTIQDGISKIKEYETIDKKDGVFEPNFYDVVNDDFISVL